MVMQRPDRRRRMRWDGYVFAIGTILSLPCLAREHHVRQLIGVVASRETGRSVSIVDADKANAREAFMSAQILAHRASLLALNERRSLLDKAESLLDRADAHRPDWGQSFLIRAYVIGLRRNAVNVESTQWIERSYRYAPFLYPEGGWRVIYGVASWSGLNSSARGNVVREAVGMSFVDGKVRTDTENAIRISPAWSEYQASRDAAWVKSGLIRL